MADKRTCRRRGIPVWNIMKAKSVKKPETKSKTAASLRDLPARKDAKGGRIRLKEEAVK